MAARQSWQTQLIEGISDVAQLFQLLELNEHDLNQVTDSSFKLKVPLSFVKRMKKGDFNDPLLRQILPLKDESVIIPGFSQDPLQEKQHNPLPGLIHKYKSRVLLTLTGACAVHCRYCFRRHFPYEANIPNQEKLAAIVEYIEKHPKINEVILSGGDPLLVPDHKLASLIALFSRMPQLKVIRIHTRLPIVLPDRITDEFLHVIKSSSIKLIMVVHCNHPQEIDDAVLSSLIRLREAGMTVFNQAVLLKGVNDDAKVLAKLSWRLFEANVLPYYLHVLDKVAGAHHFDVDDARALEIWKALQVNLPGYLLPKLVREDAGGLSKTLLFEISDK